MEGVFSSTIRRNILSVPVNYGGEDPARGSVVSKDA